jgi:hypothetical protein
MTEHRVPGPEGTEPPESPAASTQQGADAVAPPGAPGGGAHPVVWFAERVHAVLDDLVDATVWSLTAEEQRQAAMALQRAESRVAALKLRVLAAGDANDIGKVDASPSTGAWFANATRRTRPAAQGDVRLAKALDKRWGRVAAALAAGSVHVEQARVIVQALQALPSSTSQEDLAHAEQHLLGLASQHDPGDLAGLGKHLAEVLDPANADQKEAARLAAEEAEARKKATLTMRDNGDGTVSGRFKLPALHAHMLTTALEAFTAPRRLGPEGRRDEHGNRLGRPDLLGMGLCELIERYPVGKLPQSGGVNATVVVTMTLEQLLGGHGAAKVIGGTVPTHPLSGAVGPDGELLISAGEARRLACQSGVIPAVLGSDSEVLDLGRKVRLHDTKQRIAIRIRDKRCRTLGCDRPATWCHAHHFGKAWAHGGTTTAHDGLALCPWHHGKVHDPAYDISLTPDRRVTFTRRT